MAGVAVCFALLFRAERCHWIWGSRCGARMGAAPTPGPMAQSFVGACLIGLMIGLARPRLPRSSSPSPA